MSLRRAALFAPLLVLIAGCSAQAPDPVVMTAEEQEDWEIRLVEHRIDKNEEFMDAAQSPLKAEDLPGFVGLNYYYPEAGFRWVVPFRATDGGEIVQLVKRRGETVDYRLRGEVAFRHLEVEYKLAVYGPVDTEQHGDYLWLPFFDATSGETTYGGGRYLDLEVDDAGHVELDFNFAYNPLCDYNPEQFNCTLPPARNTLPFAVPAGEKLFALEE